MNTKFLAVIIGILGFMSTKAQAQGMVFVAQDVPSSSYNGVITYPEVLIHIPPTGEDNVKIKNTYFVDKNAPAKGQEDKNISYYVQKLNLTLGQMARAQEISDAGRAKHEELLQEIEKLRQQAHELERKDLEAFEALLTDEQKTEFYKLKNEQDKADATDGNNGDSEPAPQPDNPPAPIDNIPPAPQPDIPPAPVEDIPPAPQPDFNPAPVEDVPPAPQPDFNPAPVEDIPPAPQPDFQPEPQP